MVRLCVRPMPETIASLAQRPSLHQSYPASSVLWRCPTSPTPSASLGSSPRRAYPDPLARRGQGASEISKVAMSSDCQTRSGLRPRVLMKHWPLMHFMMLPSVIATTSAPPSGTLFRGSIPFTAGQLPRSIRPRLLSRPVLQRLRRLRRRWVRYEAPWLGPTSAGSAPA